VIKKTIYVACHKDCWTSKHPEYIKIQVGAAIADKRLAMLGDDTGESISKKNKNYSELAALYWIWKNDKTSDVVGLCHYRRYFAFQEIDSTKGPMLTEENVEEIIEKIIDPVNIEALFDTYEIILPVPYIMQVTVEQQYCYFHISEDWKILKEVIATLFPDYTGSMEQVFQGEKLYSCNMLVMKKKALDEYAEWLFAILDEVEKKVKISTDSYQARVFGYMAERLLNLYVYHHGLRIKEYPIVFLDKA